MAQITGFDRSLYYDDLNVGDTYVSQSRTITEGDVMLFAGLTGDHVQLHTEPTVRRKEQMGTAHRARHADALRILRAERPDGSV